jgi:hypothetical protein
VSLTNRSKLIHVLIGKSVLETLLVGGLAVVFYLQAFPPYFHGWGEATQNSIAGWVVNDASPFDRVRVQLHVDGQFVSEAIANVSRPDVVAEGWAKDEWHGYSFNLLRLVQGTHEARVFAVHESSERQITLQLLGDPIRFVVRSDGALEDLSKRR